MVGKVLSVERHPNADRLQRYARWRRAGRRARSSAAPPTSPPGRPSRWRFPARCCPGARSSGAPKLRGVASDGMILSEAELQIGDDAEGSRSWTTMSLAARHARSAEVLPLAEPVLGARGQLEPRRLLGVYGVAREVHAFSGAPLAEPPWEGTSRPTGEGEASDYASVTVEVPELCPRFTRARVHRGDDRPLAAVAEGAADRGRPAADQQRRRHHQLRDAADRPAAARVRPRSGRPTAR